MHLEEFTRAYPEFSSKEMNSDENLYTIDTMVKNLFLKKVIQGWNLSPKDQDVFLSQITAVGEYSDGSSDYDSTSSTESMKLRTAANIDRSSLTKSIANETRQMRSTTQMYIESNSFKGTGLKSDDKIDRLVELNSGRTESSDSDYKEPMVDKPLIDGPKNNKMGPNK